ncbi:DUF4105 domain-containing protein [Mangrovibacterium marinum]|uniref:Uncharacterized protein DUF4105 n=1 Tax=Mangrovibacterium marinum TaxID=1639118 RepID=A0A2T5C200_9BACT|nr:DUF4105 domain-containing protein [Mangrovibacterium marinum]PTN08713.1 uncharacterized protein DUF4105 [Mangrovibacterium marinum]
MKRFLLFLAVSLCFAIQSFSQQIVLTNRAEISVMTCGASDLIHAIYGHTAVRVHDPVKHFDVVFNYGVFSFREPNFVYRFAKGNANYMLAPERYGDFYESYIRSGRSIREQVLNLTQQEKQQMLDFLIDNAKPENREYRYDFFFDNCATRVRDLVANQIDGELKFPDANDGLTFREHVSRYQQILPWTNLGIQLVLGSPADKLASAYDEMFLPQYLFKHFADARLSADGESRPLVLKTNTIYEAPEPKLSMLAVYSPEIILTLLLVLVAWVSFRQLKGSKRHYGIDSVLLFIHGLIGVVLLWFFLYSEHPEMKANYNQLWAVCFNLPFLFLWLIRPWRRLLRWYWVVLSAWLLLFFPLSIFLPQHFEMGFYLLIAMLLCRSLFHSRFVLARK